MITFESISQDKVINGPIFQVFDDGLIYARLRIDLATSTYCLYHPTDYFLEAELTKEAKIAICNLLVEVSDKYIYKPEVKKYFTGIGVVARFDFDEIDRVIFVKLGEHELVFPTYKTNCSVDQSHVVSLHLGDEVAVGYSLGEGYFLHKRIEEYHRAQSFQEGEEIIKYWVKNE